MLRAAAVVCVTHRSKRGRVHLKHYRTQEALLESQIEYASGILLHHCRVQTSTPFGELFHKVVGLLASLSDVCSDCLHLLQDIEYVILYDT